MADFQFEEIENLVLLQANQRSQSSGSETRKLVSLRANKRRKQLANKLLSFIYWLNRKNNNKI